jgi:aryl-alcohol dehydrogenase-like predicted oxidoreductase
VRLRRLGRSDLEVSRLGLGTSTWGATTDLEDAAQQVKEYLDAGGNLLDTADVYGRGGSEEIIGQLLDRVVPRSAVVLASKSAAVVGPDGSPRPPDTSPGHLIAALDASLARLRTDHLDLWQIHAWDATTPVEETLSAIDTAISSGRVRHAGLCNHCGWQATKTAAAQLYRNRPPLASVQNEYSLLERGVERELVPAATDLGLGVLPWAPLGRGVLTGKYRAGVPADREKSRFFKWYVGHHLREERTAGIVAVLAEVADELGLPPGNVAVAWVRDRPGVVAPLLGARTVEQLRETLPAESVELPAEAVQRLDEVSAPYRGYPETGI